MLGPALLESTEDKLCKQSVSSWQPWGHRGWGSDPSVTTFPKASWKPFRSTWHLPFLIVLKRNWVWFHCLGFPMHVCVYSCMCTHMCMWRCVFPYVRTCACEAACSYIHTHVCTWKYVCTYMHTYVYVKVCSYMYMCACEDVCSQYTYTCMCEGVLMWWCVCSYMCTYMHMWICVFIYMNTCVNEGQRAMSGVFLDYSPPYFLRQILSLNLELIS